MTHRTTLFRIAVAIALLVLVGLALASAPVKIDARAVDFADGPSDTVFALGWCDDDDCLVLTFGVGDFGVVIIPMDDEDRYPEGPLDRINPTVALQRSEMIEKVGSGIMFVHDCCDLPNLMRHYTNTFTELGMEVLVDPANARILHASRGERSYRLVFGYEDVDEELLVRVYIGT